MAISDFGTLLYYFDSTTSKYKKLVSITQAPATGGTPSPIEVTELDSAVKQYISDRPDTPTFEFEYNYTQENFALVKQHVSLSTTNKFLIIYQDESGEKFEGTGDTWKKEVTAGTAVKAGLGINVYSHEHVEDVTSIIDDTSL